MDEPNYSLIVQLDDREHPHLDLEQSGIGAWAIDLAVERMVVTSAAGCDPQGHDWPRLAPLTVKRKGHAVVGIDTGKSGLIDPATYARGPRQVLARVATWTHPWASDPRRSGQLEGWQFGAPEMNLPPRPLVGWHPDDVAAIEQRVAEEDAAVRFRADE